MTDMPITAWLEEPEIFDAMGFWQAAQSGYLVQYTRTDIATASEKAAYVAGMWEAARIACLWWVGDRSTSPHQAIRAAADKMEAGE